MSGWLVTGGCGFVGSNLADSLLSRGQDVVVLDNLGRVGSRDNLAWLRARHGSEFRFVEADVRDARAIERVVAEAQPLALAHLAGQVAMTTSIENPRLDFETNALGTVNVLEAVRLRSPGTIVVYSSSNKVYGGLDGVRVEEAATRYVLPDHPHGLDETQPLSGHSPYGCSKLSADQYVLDYHRIHGLATVVFRHSSMYGGRQFATYDQGWIGWFCRQAVDRTPFTISGDGKQVRDLLHAEDLVTAYLEAVEEVERTAGEAYNIGGGPAISLSLLELFGRLEAMTGAAMRFERLAWRASDQRVFVADWRKAERDFGWRPAVGIEAGLTQMLDWTREVAA